MTLEKMTRPMKFRELAEEQRFAIWCESWDRICTFRKRKTEGFNSVWSEGTTITSGREQQCLFNDDDDVMAYPIGWPTYLQRVQFVRLVGELIEAHPNIEDYAYQVYEQDALSALMDEVGLSAEFQEFYGGEIPYVMLRLALAKEKEKWGIDVDEHVNGKES